MTEDFVLSNKIAEIQIPCPDRKPGCLVYHFERWIEAEDVKEFIQKINDFVTRRREELKKYKTETPEKAEWIDGCRDGYRQVFSEIISLAGEKLI